MGLFGSARKRDAALADPQMYMPATEAPPIPEAASIAPQGMGTFNLAPVGQIKPHVGAFDRGGMGWQVLGAIGDSLSQMGGYGSPFATARLLQQKQQLEDAQWTRRQNSELQRQIAVEAYKVAHREPNDDQFSRSLAAAGIQPGTPEYVRLNRERALALTTRVVMTPQGPMVIGGGYGYPGQQDEGSDELPPGFTVGGPTPPASGGFPRR